VAELIDILGRRWPSFLDHTLDHLQVVLLSIGIATLLGVALAVLVYRSDRATTGALAVTSTFLTVPSFALFGLLIPVFGLGWRPTIVALTFYAIMPVTRNTVTGLRSVEREVIESARGMGMNRRQQLLRIELPLAWPVILNGIRVSTILIVSIAAIAALVFGPGLGNPIMSGMARVGGYGAIALAIWGTVLIVVVAYALDGGFRLLAKLTVSPGVRR
jgi:osmoprotectant transport system permease protein